MISRSPCPIILHAPRSTGLFDRRRSWLPYSAFAEAFLTFRRIDFAARLRWLFDLLHPRAITSGANSFGQNFTLFFHNDQSLKQDKKLNLFDNG
jgi:hypothetical protein